MLYYELSGPFPILNFEEFKDPRIWKASTIRWLKKDLLNAKIVYLICIKDIVSDELVLAPDSRSGTIDEYRLIISAIDTFNKYIRKHKNNLDIVSIVGTKVQVSGDEVRVKSEEDMLIKEMRYDITSKEGKRFRTLCS